MFAVTAVRGIKHAKEESEEEFDARMVVYFSRRDIDGWEVRKAMNELQVCLSVGRAINWAASCEKKP